MKNLIYSVIMALFLILLLPACKKKEKTPEAIRVVYYQNAQKFCQAITGCIQAEIAQRLKSEPKRRDMVIQRMNRDLCQQNQFHLLGSLQADPNGPGAVDFNKKLYDDFERCAHELSVAPNCQMVRQKYNQLDECRRIRKKSAQKDSL